MIFDQKNWRDHEKKGWEILVLFRLGINLNLAIGYISMSVNPLGSWNRRQAPMYTPEKSFARG